MRGISVRSGEHVRVSKSCRTISAGLWWRSTHSNKPRFDVGILKYIPQWSSAFHVMDACNSRIFKILNPSSLKIHPQPHNWFSLHMQYFNL